MLQLFSHDTITFVLQPKKNDKEYKLSNEESISLVILNKGRKNTYFATYNSEEASCPTIKIDASNFCGKCYYYFCYTNSATGEEYLLSQISPVIFLRSVTKLNG